MKKFYVLLVVLLAVSVTNNFVWFALTFWAYLTTHSVVSTGAIGGIFAVAGAVSSFWFGSLVDHYRKKYVMMGSSAVSAIFFAAGYALYRSYPEVLFGNLSQPYFWIFALTLLMGTMAGSLYQIAVPTLVTILVPESTRDKANGMVGMVMGISFAITSVISGLTLAYGGMGTVLLIATVMTLVILLGLSMVAIPEKKVVHVQEHKTSKVDMSGTIAAIKKIPGMFALIFFTTFNNLVGGVFMALMDAYGLTMVSVQTWGTIWGFLSFGFIFGGMAIAKWGLGVEPLKTLFRVNTAIWLACILFPLQPSIVLVILGALVWMSLFPYIEATEQTIVQKVVPYERQGRVLGFAHSVEQAATPVTAFLIGPVAQYVFIPFMTTGVGVKLIGSWFGVGPGRGIALVFIMAGMIGLVVTTLAKKMPAYQLLADKMREK